MLTTFLVTAIMVRIWPIKKISDEYFEGEGYPEGTVTEKYFSNAWNKALDVTDTATSLGSNMWKQFKEALIMTMNILPAMMSIGLIGLLLAEYTPIFDYIGYIFYPLTLVLQVPDALLAAKAAPLGITEILLPSIIVIDAGLVTKFIVATVSVSGILFFSTSIPSILSTEIPLSILKIVVIWFIRTILSFIIVVPIAHLML